MRLPSTPDLDVRSCFPTTPLDLLVCEERGVGMKVQPFGQTLSEEVGVAALDGEEEGFDGSWVERRVEEGRVGGPECVEEGLDGLGGEREDLGGRRRRRREGGGQQSRRRKDRDPSKRKERRTCRGIVCTTSTRMEVPVLDRSGLIPFWSETRRFSNDHERQGLSPSGSQDDHASRGSLEEVCSSIQLSGKAERREQKGQRGNQR